MKTKTIPFDLETVMKIQAGEIEGKIRTRNGYPARILCLDLLGSSQPVVAAYISNNGIESVLHCTKNGYYCTTEESCDFDLVLEVADNEPERPQFKPFDKVLVRDNDASLWRAGFYSHELDGRHCICGNYYPQCIPYEGNQELVGTTKKPKEK